MSSKRVDPVVAAMEKMERQRQARRNKAEKFRRDRLAEEKRNEAEGRPGDVDFQRLIKKWRREHQKEEKEVRRVVCWRGVRVYRGRVRGVSTAWAALAHVAMWRHTQHAAPGSMKIVVCARKRPVNTDEKRRKDFDAVCDGLLVVAETCRGLHSHTHAVRRCRASTRKFTCTLRS